MDNPVFRSPYESSPQEYFPASVDSSIISPFRRVVRALKDRGATVLPVSLPNISCPECVLWSSPAQRRTATSRATTAPSTACPSSCSATLYPDHRVKCMHIRVRRLRRGREETRLAAWYTRLRGGLVLLASTPVHSRQRYLRLSRAQPARSRSGDERSWRP